MADRKTQILRKIIYGLLIAAGLGVLLFFFVVRPLQIHKQKQDFDKAEASLDALAAKIEQTIGKPDETKKVKSCGRPNLKYEIGQLSCDIEVRVLYKNTGVEKSNQLMRSLSSSQIDKLHIGPGGSTDLIFLPRESLSGTQVFLQKAPTLYGLTCGYSYRFPSDIDQTDSNVVGENFLVSISCGGSSMKEFYPVTK